jgi:hypothetical protein
VTFFREIREELIRSRRRPRADGGLAREVDALDAAAAAPPAAERRRTLLRSRAPAPQGDRRPGDDAAGTPRSATCWTAPGILDALGGPRTTGPSPERLRRPRGPRPTGWANEMDFAFLFDSQRQALHHRDTAWRTPKVRAVLDPTFYDLLASKARSQATSPFRRCDVPQTHWFHLIRQLVNVKGLGRRWCPGARRCSST